MAKQADAESKYAAFFKQAGRTPTTDSMVESTKLQSSTSLDTENQIAVSTESNTSVNLDSQRQAVIKTVTFKAPEDVRLHWVIEARRDKTTLSEVCRQALIERYGLPDGWKVEDL